MKVKMSAESKKILNYDAYKVLEELYQKIEAKLDETRDTREFDRLIAKRSAMYAALTVLSGEIKSENIVKETASMILFG